jgi:hypothetical protein
MDVPSPRLAIYAALEKLLVPAQLSAPWDVYSAPPGYLESAPDSERCLAQLQSRFSRADLVAAGVLVAPASPDAPSELHPELKMPGRKWLSLRTEPGLPPFDFLTDSGSLSGQLPILASRQDFRVRKLLGRADGELLATATIEDAAVLLAIGLPATISVGLRRCQT